MKLLKELIQSIHNYKTTLETEKLRRTTWEQQREAGYLARQSGLQARIAVMEQEVETLKASIHSTQLQTANGRSGQAMSTPNLGDQLEGTSVVSSLASQVSSETNGTEFVQGSSRQSSLLGKRLRRSPSNEAPNLGKRTHKELRSQSLQVRSFVFTNTKQLNYLKVCDA